LEKKIQEYETRLSYMKKKKEKAAKSRGNLLVGGSSRNRLIQNNLTNLSKGGIL
jgi:hypothetical protein